VKCANDRKNTDCENRTIQINRSHRHKMPRPLFLFASQGPFAYHCARLKSCGHIQIDYYGLPCWYMNFQLHFPILLVVCRDFNARRSLHSLL
jgi:hypothetical protein